MLLRNSPTEILTRRWVEGEIRHDLQLLQYGGSHAAVSRALSALCGYVRTLTRRPGRAVNLEISGRITEVLGWKAGTRVVVGVTEGGEIRIRTATPADLPGYALPTIEAADQLLAAREPQSQLSHYERTCQQCGDLFCARSPNVRYCKLCAWRRRRASDRRWWARAGKQSPSYQRKVRPRAPAGEIPVPAVA
jgi:hypothetical protein